MVVYFKGKRLVIVSKKKKNDLRKHLIFFVSIDRKWCDLINYNLYYKNFLIFDPNSKTN